MRVRRPREHDVGATGIRLRWNAGAGGVERPDDHPVRRFPRPPWSRPPAPSGSSRRTSRSGRRPWPCRRCQACRSRAAAASATWPIPARRSPARQRRRARCCRPASGCRRIRSCSRGPGSPCPSGRAGKRRPGRRCAPGPPPEHRRMYSSSALVSAAPWARSVVDESSDSTAVGSRIVRVIGPSLGTPSRTASRGLGRVRRGCSAAMRRHWGILEAGPALARQAASRVMPDADGRSLHEEAGREPRWSVGLTSR